MGKMRREQGRHARAMYEMRQEKRMAKEIYNSPFLGGEVEMHTEPDPVNPGRVIITYYLNGEEITREEAQALMDEAKRRAQH